MPKYSIELLKRRAMKNIFAQSPAINESHYGKPETLETSAGRKVVIEFGNDSLTYFIPADAIWTAGVGAIQIDKAYRILDESQGKAKVREVKDFSELESVASGLIMEILKYLPR